MRASIKVPSMTPAFFELILKVVTKTPFKNTAFRAYTGELEAWGEKP